MEQLSYSQKIENPDNYYQKEHKQMSKQIIKSVITFDKGGIWRPIAAPLKDSSNQRVWCPDDKCSLHLHMLSSSKYGPIYSTEKAKGLILATGNIG